MVLGIFDGFVELKDIIYPLIEFLVNGLKQLVDFVISLPQLFNDLIHIIPQPLSTIIFSFIGILIVVIILRVVK